MNRYVLRSPEDADATLADLLHQSVVAGAGTITLRLDIREDACFRSDCWVSAGAVTLHPESADASQDRGDGKSALQRALRYGFFDWTLPVRSAWRGKSPRLWQVRLNANSPTEIAPESEKPPRR